MVGVKRPASEKIGLHPIGPVDVESLRDLIQNQRAGAECALGPEVRPLRCYEAGHEGFWLERWLNREMSIETVVLDPASPLVNWKAKQRKTDRIDAKKMVRALLAHDRGAAAVLSQMRVPSVEEEDRKRLLRERRRLVKERTPLTNSIKGLLKLQRASVAQADALNQRRHRSLSLGDLLTVAAPRPYASTCNRQRASRQVGSPAECKSPRSGSG